MLMAVRCPVTESIAAETRGALSLTVSVSIVARETSDGRISEADGTSRTSSKVYAGGMF
jgi:hypothetical protein